MDDVQRSDFLFLCAILIIAGVWVYTTVGDPGELQYNCETNEAILGIDGSMYCVEITDYKQYI